VSALRAFDFWVATMVPRLRFAAAGANFAKALRAKLPI
jgi:hypothetical protein